MPPEETVWALDEHTRGKHQVLEKYLGAWYGILGQSHPKVVFIDGFAGPGVYSGAEEGSPVVAIRTFIEHRSRGLIRAEPRFLFIEERTDRASTLREVIPARFPDQVGWHYQVVDGEFEPTLSELLDDLERTGMVMAPAFVMIDPFGVKGFSLEVVRRILAHPRSEVYISFIYSFVHRFCDHIAFEEPLTAIFGGTDWRPGAAIPDPVDRRQFFFDLYRQKLKAAGASYVIRFDLWRGGQLVYSIFFGTKGLKGCDEMKKAIWGAIPGGDYQFRGGRSGQLALDLTATDVARFGEELLARYSGQRVGIEELERFARSDETLFHSGHLKRDTLRPLEQAERITVFRPAGARRGAFTPGVELAFP